MDAPGEEFRRIYRRRFPPAGRKARADLWKALVEGFFQKWIGPEQTVLDLGCGFGEFLNHVRCARRIGVDLNDQGAAQLDPAIEFHAGDVCDLGFLSDASVDTVFTSNLMEHLPGKPAVDKMLGEARRVLRPGGQFIALGPNLRLLPGAYWDFWDHVVPITDRSLVEALELGGFEIADCIRRFLPYTTCSRMPQGPLLVRWYLRFRPAWRLFGRQFLVRARKAEGK